MTKPPITLRGLALAFAVLPVLPAVTRGVRVPPADTGAQDNAPTPAKPLARASGD